jgi:[acyl-carrier-protein] S-malonyltransferase
MKLAFVFPGQGSQSVGMMQGFADSAAAKAVLTEASEALGEDLATLMANGPAETLSLTTNTQPVMLTAGLTSFAAWREAGGPMPTIVAGHSLGEYTALVAVGVLTLADAVRLVRVRAQAMQAAVPAGEGAMAAILGLEDDAVRAACLEASDTGVVQAVNFNAPSQVVIAGTKAAVDRACELARQKGAKRALLLAVSAPFHCSLMKPAADVLRAALSQMQLMPPTIDVVNNVDVAIESDVDRIRDALVRQAWHPVRWVETIYKMRDMGVTHIVECGPGKVLQGLVKRIAPQVQSLALTDTASLLEIKGVLQ